MINHSSPKTNSDQQDMLKLAQALKGEHFHITDLPYRFSSWAFDEPDNISLWRDEQGYLLAWAMMQTPFWTVDITCRPDAVEILYPDILAWADDRARLLLDTPFGHDLWFVGVFERHLDRIAALERAGFADQADVGDDSLSSVWMQLQDNLLISNMEAPVGFNIRSLNGNREVEAYVGLHRAVFESKNMTLEWRQRTLKRPEYRPELDLVAVDSDGNLAAFCICWMDQNNRGQVEPLGVLPDLRGLGLGKAILHEGLNRLQNLGVQQIYVETDRFRNAALDLYKSAGFRVIEDIHIFRKDYG